MNMQIAEGILIPFLGTSFGAAMVFFLKKQISGRIRKALTGFAAGVMVAASFWSLLQPALDSSAGMGTLAFLPVAAGFLAGVGFLLALDGKFDTITNLTASLTCVSNVGPGLGSVGPVENFASFGIWGKVVCSFLMLFGRLELLPMFILFTRSAWRKY